MLDFENCEVAEFETTTYANVLTYFDGEIACSFTFNRKLDENSHLYVRTLDQKSWSMIHEYSLSRKRTPLYVFLGDILGIGYEHFHEIKNVTMKKQLIARLKLHLLLKEE